MTQLPPNLTQWSHLLQLFPHDVISELGALIRTLNSLIGPLNSDALKGIQEPNGYSGITRQVNYHRLLTSEWVLMDLHQDEFLRRAVSGEHLFHQLEHVEPKTAKASYVLFDAGPSQLGKPRVVQLALLILLARRAEKVKANFYWGVLQDSNRIWNSSVDIPSIKRWLNLRSVSLACSADIDSWINEQHDSLQDLWIISPENINTDEPIKKIAITAILFDDKRLKINVSGKTLKKELTIDLPSLEVQTKILRDPFLTTSREPNNNDWDSNFGWHLSSNGSLLVYMGQKNTITSLRLPNAGNQKLVYRNRFTVPAGYNLVGVYITRKRMCVAYCNKTQFHLYNFPDIGKVKSVELTQSFLPSQRLDTLILTNDAKHKTAVLLLDAKKSLRKLTLDSDDHLLSTVAKDVIYLAQVDNCQFYVCHEREHSRITLTWLPQNGWPQESTFPVNTVQAPQCFAHGSRSWNKHQLGIFAYEFTSTTWKIVDQGPTRIIPVHPEQKIVGVLFLNDWSFNDGTKANKTSCLVAIDEDNIHVSLLFENTQRKLLKLPSTFVLGEINCALPLLHYVNDKVENITVCLKTGSELLRLCSGAYDDAN